ncbi:MAG: hypothetical protein IPP38_07030 [Bacteroidetes bacterium]|nr:hypothetical protein [Bacteroidota bacterium]
MKKLIKLAFLTLWGGISIASAQTPAVVLSDKTGWHKIGERTVDFKKDRDEVMVMVADRFSALQFKVDEAAIELVSIEVYYESGDKQDLALRTRLNAGESSRVIDLNGGERNLKKVVFVYKTLANAKDEKAHVEIWGQKTNLDKQGKAEASSMQAPSVVLSDKKGWHKIGSRSVDFVRDHDEFVVVGADRFASIQFRVSEASIQLISLEVFYESGDNQKIAVNSPVLNGTASKIIDLNGGERSLKKIVFEYKTIPNQKEEKAMVEMWGLKTNIAVR